MSHPLKMPLYGPEKGKPATQQPYKKTAEKAGKTAGERNRTMIDTLTAKAKAVEAFFTGLPPVERAEAGIMAATDHMATHTDAHGQPTQEAKKAAHEARQAVIAQAEQRAGTTLYERHSQQGGKG